MVDLCQCAAEESKYSDGRIIQCFMYVRSGSVHDNHYAHPLDLVVFLDMNTGRVLDTLMQATSPVIPQLSTNYLAPLVQKERGFRSGALTDPYWGPVRPGASNELVPYSRLCCIASMHAS